MSERKLQTFQLDSPLQLLLKLGWGIKGLRGYLNSGDAAENFFPAIYTAFDCAITAWQMTDWVWGFYSETVSLPQSQDPRFKKAERLGKFQAWICEQSNYLRICKHIANSNKHFGVDRHHDPSLKLSVDWSYESFTAGMAVGQPLVRPSWKLSVADTQGRYEALHVLEQAFEFWAMQINEPSLIGYLNDPSN
jgi:hypothetical protein